MAATNEVQAKYQAMTAEYQKLQDDLQTSISAREKLEAQEQENIGVQKEFQSLSSGSNIYKLIGPVLMKQERAEAQAAVDGRLEYIRSEIKRIEQQLSGLQEKSEAKKMEIYQFQMQYQQQEEGAAQGQEQAQIA